MSKRPSITVTIPHKDYEVGYGKPPKEAQFQPGQSGNPAGRPRDSRNVKKVLHEVAGEEMEIFENGERRLVSKQEALVRSLFARALKGDMRATQMLFKAWTEFAFRYSR